MAHSSCCLLLRLQLPVAALLELELLLLRIVLSALHTPVWLTARPC